MKVFRLALIVLLLFASNAAAAAISVRADYWPPFNTDPKSAKTGYMIETLRAIFAPLGHSIDYDTLSWEESIEEVRKGKFTAIVGSSKDDAPDFVFPAESFGVSAVNFFVKAGNPWKYSGLKSLDAVRLGVIKAYAYNDELDAYIEASRKSGRLVEATGDEALPELIRMLQAGKIDVVAEDPNVMMFNLMDLNLPLGQIAGAGAMPQKTDIYVAFSPAVPAAKTYARQFDEGIRKLRSSGELQRILVRYGLKDWK